jgi:multidrug efflux pump subunit AcrA (membrane-fusion protein)
MKQNLVRLFGLSVVIVFLVTACSAPASGTVGEPTVIPPVAADTQVVAEGRIAPRDDVYLSFFASGQVSEALVKEGDKVKAGEVVARLGNRAEIEAGMANAKVELLAAQQARDELNENVEVARAAAARAISEANRAVRDAQYTRDNFTTPTNQQNMTAMEAVVKMKETLDKARATFDAVKYRPSDDTERERLKDELDSAQSDYNAAVRRLEYETSLNQAQAGLDKAIQDFQALQDGPNPDQLATVEARIAAAEAAIHSADTALTNLELKSTIDGVVLEQNLIVGQTVTPGAPVMRIVDFSQMYVETSDLTELEVVEISLGQSVSVLADALPELTLNGTVEKIADVFVERNGDITYTVRIALKELDPRLRWGMTVVVKFQK